MERQYSHLTWKNRLKIRRMLDERRKPKEIADALHVHTSTIYREIKRGQTWQMTSEWEYVQKYCPETAERKYRENLQAKGPDLKIGNDHALASYLEEKIGKEHYSPAAALAKIKEEGPVFGFGMGDVILMAAGGLMLGLKATITAGIIAVVLGAIYGVILKYIRRNDDSEDSNVFAFGPFLIIGLAVGAFVNGSLIDMYLNSLHIGR